MLERWLGRWLQHWHGLGEPWQHDYYECRGCRRLVTHRRLAAGGCGCGANTIMAVQLTWWQKARALLAPWSL